MIISVNAKFEVAKCEANKEYHKWFRPIEQRITSKAHDNEDECYKDVHQKCMELCEEFAEGMEEDENFTYQYSWCGEERFANNELPLFFLNGELAL